MIAEVRPTPMGVTWEGDGWSLALYSRHATGVTLLLDDSNDLLKPVALFKFNQLQDTCIAE